MSSLFVVFFQFLNSPRFDWMRNEPNDWHSQNCLTFLKDQVISSFEGTKYYQYIQLLENEKLAVSCFQDIFGFGAYHWNDWDCKAMARYICEKDADYIF